MRKVSTAKVICNKKKKGIKMKYDGVHYKELILNLLKDKSLRTNELKELTGLPKEQLMNYLSSLRHLKLIAFENKETAEIPSKLKHVRISSKSYLEVYTHRKHKAAMLAPKNYHANIQFSPYATMKSTSDDYHTRGAKNKISAWAGYGSL